MSVIVKIQTQNYSGKTASITFFPDTGGAIDVGSHVVPYDYYAEYYYGVYELYFSEYGDTCIFEVPNPNPITTTTTTTGTTDIFRGLYLNDFNLIVGDSTEENLVYSWVQNNNINHVYCYDLTGVLSTLTGRNNVRNFNETIRTFGVTHIGGIGASERTLVGSGTTGDNSRLYYNNECTIPEQRYDILNLESEFWNYNGNSPYIIPGTNGQLRWDNGGTDDWESQNSSIYTSGHSNSLSTDFYIGLIRDGKNSPATPPLIDKVSPSDIALNLVNNTDRVLLTCYLTTDQFTGTTDAGFNEIVNNLTLLGTAATTSSKVIDVVILFNAKDEFMKSYFVNHLLDEAYDNVLTSFNNTSFIGKEGINLIGYMIYGYQQVKDILTALPFLLGRHYAPDIRDRNYLIKDKVTAPPQKITSKYWANNEWWGDQGNTPQCVGYAWAHWIEDGPVTHGGVAPIIHPTLIYKEAQKLDEWIGENYDGTSVRGAAKYLQKNKKIGNYYWAFDLNTLVNTVLNVGPVVVGTYWYLRMFYPDKTGLIKIGGPIMGGHAYVINGVDVNKKLFRIKNSWGKKWGVNGSAYISFNDMNLLIKMGGEICLATENKF